MALINKLEAIGDAIREKTGGTEEMTLDEMATAISSLTTGNVTTTGELKYAILTNNSTSTTKFDIGYYVPSKTSKFMIFFSYSTDGSNYQKAVFYNNGKSTIGTLTPNVLNKTTDTYAAYGVYGFMTSPTGFAPKSYLSTSVNDPTGSVTGQSIMYFNVELASATSTLYVGQSALLLYVG